MEFRTLETARLTLRRFRTNDSEALFNLRVEPETAKFQNRENYTLQQAQAFVDWAEHAPFGNPGWFACAIEHKHTQRLIGDVSFNLLDFLPRTAELGYTLARQDWGHGLASEAVHAVTDLLFDILKMHRVIAYAAVQNQRSWALLERLGFRREGSSVQSYLVAGEWLDEHQYAMLEQEWRA